MAIKTLAILSLVAVGFLSTACESIPEPSPEPSSQVSTACMSHADMVAYLRDRYGESPVAIGISRNGYLVEVFAQPDGETWTIVVTGPVQSCAIAAGRDWQVRQAGVQL